MPDNLYHALHESHERQRTLCRRLVRARAEVDYREALQRELKRELAAHAAAEERFLYAVILMHDAGLDASRHALHEHHQIDECVDALERADPAAPTWHAAAKALSHEVHHHLREEETKFFQVSGRILGARQKHTLTGRYRRDYARMLRTLEKK